MAASATGPPLDGLQRKEAKAVERMLGEPEQLAERLREYATNESRLLLSIAQGADQDCASVCTEASLGELAVYWLSCWSRPCWRGLTNPPLSWT